MFVPQDVVMFVPQDVVVMFAPQDVVMFVPQDVVVAEYGGLLFSFVFVSTIGDKIEQNINNNYVK